MSLQPHSAPINVSGHFSTTAAAASTAGAGRRKKDPQAVTARAASPNLHPFSLFKAMYARMWHRAYTRARKFVSRMFRRFLNIVFEARHVKVVFGS